MSELPPELLEDVRETDHPAILGRWAVQQSLKLPFGQEKLMRLARLEFTEDSWESAILKGWSSVFGNRRGLLRADIEVEAVMLGVDGAIYGSIEELA